MAGYLKLKVSLTNMASSYIWYKNVSSQSFCRSIWPIDGILTGTTTLSQEKKLHNPQGSLLNPVKGQAQDKKQDLI